jgi:ABC-type multidrug transport system fused ATPase/permease subunit
MNSFVRMGHKKPLEQHDLHRMRPQDQVLAVQKRFDTIWAHEQKTSKTPSLGRAIWKLTRWDVIFQACLEVTNRCTQISGPLLLQQVILFVQDPTIDEMRGYYLVLAILGLAIISGLTAAHSIRMCLTSQLHATAAIRSSVFTKALQISLASRSGQSSGSVINLMSIDSDAVGMLFFSCHAVWVSPIFIGICLWQLHGLLGASAFVGLATMFVMVPFMLSFMMEQKKCIGKRMKSMDIRVKFISEIIQGIKVLKYNAWEDRFAELATEKRTAELKHLKKLVMSQVKFHTFIMSSPIMVSTFVLITYTFVGGKNLAAADIFPALALFNAMRFPLMSLPMSLANYASAFVSLKRIKTFLTLPEKLVDAQDDDAPERVTMKNASFSWGQSAKADKEDGKATPSTDNALALGGEEIEAGVVADDSVVQVFDQPEDVDTDSSETNAGEVAPRTILEDCTFDAPAGKLTSIVGSVGAGKSSLLFALLGEMEAVGDSGSVTLTPRDAVAYVAQTAWIQNKSVRQNIIFDTPFNAEKYEQVLRACCLHDDLASFPAGDATEIGERGVNLSGGQKQRVALARAAYSPARVFLFDDVLSAVDAHVGRKIFDSLLRGLLKGKTILLVTHQLHFVPETDYVLSVANGKIVEQGTHTELMQQDGYFSKLMQKHVGGHDDSSGDESATTTTLALKKQDSLPLTKQDSLPLDAPKANEKDGKLITAEERNTGRISSDVYWFYINKMGGLSSSITLIMFFLLSQAMATGTDIWVMYWTDKENKFSLSQVEYLYGYVVFAVLAICLTGGRGVMFTYKSVRASSHMHSVMLDNLVRATPAFFDVTPTGRILNRFSGDIDKIDAMLPRMAENYLSIGLWVIGSLCVITFVSPYSILPILPMLFVYKSTTDYYRPTAIELQRLESISRSPVYAFFSETLDGLPTIRAFAKGNRFFQVQFKNLEVWQASQMCSNNSRRWLDMRLLLVNITIQCSAVIFLVLARNNVIDMDITPGEAGLSVMNALSISGVLTFLVMMSVQVEATMNSVERVKHYTNLPQEAARIVATARPTDDSKEWAAWPQKGTVDFKDVKVRYRPELDLVLKGCTLSIGVHEHVGVVGRTGSGKSTLMVTLFRLVEASEGVLGIDSVSDVSKLGLHDLRSRLAIIPQEPVLFSGTVRRNLDPLDDYSEDELWHALQQVNMAGVIRNNGDSSDTEKTDEKTDAVEPGAIQIVPANLASGLDMEVEESGRNFSVGQRQLLCVARVLLQKPRVLVMDEATASVDVETDMLIQRMIRTEFTKCTVLCIAHRLNTIMDYDRVVVMGDGGVLEFDTPSKLLADETSSLYSMAEQTGHAQHLRDIADGKVVS